MKLDIRLRHVLRHYGIPEHGAQAKLADFLNVDRQTVARFFNNRTTHLSLAHIEGLCRWLLEQVKKSEKRNELRRELPGCLFSMSGLWERMFRSEVVTSYLGEKVLIPNEDSRQLLAASPEWLSSMDVTATLKITQRLAREESSARQDTQLVRFHLEEHPRASASASERFAQRQATDRAAAMGLFRVARKAKRTTSLIIGSQKVNALTEIFTAEYFGVEPFKIPKKPLPFYVSYRKTDPSTPASCFGGHDKPADVAGEREPGIYYRDEQGESVLAPWVSRRSSAGVVLVHHDETRDSVEVVLFGFCAPGTRHLGDIFCDDPDRFWPTTADTKRRFGAFVCPMRFQDDEEVTLADHQVIELPAAMLDSVRGASANSSEALTD